MDIYKPYVYYIPKQINKQADNSDNERLNEFVEGLIVDPLESTPGKSPTRKKRKTGKGSSKDVESKPTSSTRTPPPPPTNGARPLEELFDHLSREIGSYLAKEFCLLKNQVNDTNMLREKLKE
ncbi:hypothetical protein Hanom_Chr13g01200251 [Helianthus anomalus]